MTDLNKPVKLMSILIVFILAIGLLVAGYEIGRVTTPKTADIPNGAVLGSSDTFISLAPTGMISLYHKSTGKIFFISDSSARSIFAMYSAKVYTEGTRNAGNPTKGLQY